MVYDTPCIPLNIVHAFNFPFSSHNESKYKHKYTHNPHPTHIYRQCRDCSALYNVYRIVFINTTTLSIRLWPLILWEFCADSPHDAFRLLISPFNSFLLFLSLCVCVFFFVPGERKVKNYYYYERDERHRSWFEFRWHFYAFCCHVRTYRTPLLLLLQNLIQFLCSVRLCLFRRIYLFDEKLSPSISILAVRKSFEVRQQPAANNHRHQRGTVAYYLVPKTNRNKRKIALQTTVQHIHRTHIEQVYDWIAVEFSLSFWYNSP